MLRRRIVGISRRQLFKGSGKEYPLHRECPLKTTWFLDALKVTLASISWRVALKSLLIFGGLNLLWEFAQLPLYDIWYQAPAGEIAFAVLHCTAGDILIGISCAIVALLLAIGFSRYPHPPLRTVGLLFVPIAVGYTVYSEWLNVSVRKSWSYSELMPTIQPLGTGLSPLLQWVILPIIMICIVNIRQRRSQ